MFALEGIDWRGWSAADRAAVAFLLLKRQNRDDPTMLRELFVLVEDSDAVAELDRQMMSQPRQVEATNVRPRHG
jgi:hypothetical protein